MHEQAIEKLKDEAELKRGHIRWALKRIADNETDNARLANEVEEDEAKVAELEVAIEALSVGIEATA